GEPARFWRRRKSLLTTSFPFLRMGSGFFAPSSIDPAATSWLATIFGNPNLWVIESTTGRYEEAAAELSPAYDYEVTRNRPSGKFRQHRFTLAVAITF
ncbi:MAG TPA: hypothetical protein VEX68_02910, partial [Bryobacteraceae bacterium]|nr:hypothetical protein [Bryobacteraceae bacterium]